MTFSDIHIVFILLKLFWYFASNGPYLFHADLAMGLMQVHDIELNFKKAVMDQTFEKNRKRPNDPDFKYDVEVDFAAGPVETCDWDSDDDNDDNGF